jgi:hypothetical protein
MKILEVTPEDILFRIDIKVLLSADYIIIKQSEEEKIAINTKNIDTIYVDKERYALISTPSREITIRNYQGSINVDYEKTMHDVGVYLMKE